METYQESMARLEKIKQKAFANGDTVLYAVLCDELGLDECGRSELFYREGKTKLETDYIDISKNPLLRIKCKLTESEIACLPETDIRRYLPNLIKKNAFRR